MISRRGLFGLVAGLLGVAVFGRGGKQNSIDAAEVEVDAMTLTVYFRAPTGEVEAHSVPFTYEETFNA